ncbi:glycosyltransferase [Pseudomonas putida]|uniref:glycosyltransferase n=1 Tax=Pseudomonas putida TaxID=303 RepID=UPI00162712DA|nr:glycosyltransferase [Pseudomonas putida]QNG08298.1 glycosyltransferase [Pseudomonas putida]
METIGSVKGGEWDIQEAQYVAEGYEKLIKKMDCCIASTPALKTYIEESYSKPTLLLRNAITPEMMRSPKLKDFKRLNLLYASGTYSHKADFMMVEELLFQTLRNHPEVKLSILGAAQASERILSLDNVSSYPLLPYDSMLDFIAKHDMLLVPLEDSIFNRAKSNVKFIEAAAMGVPVLASAVGEFSQSITHGSNGFLAHDLNDWQVLLNEIIQKPKQLKNISKTLIRRLKRAI